MSCMLYYVSHKYDIARPREDRIEDISAKEQYRILSKFLVALDFLFTADCTTRSQSKLS